MTNLPNVKDFFVRPERTRLGDLGTELLHKFYVINPGPGKVWFDFCGWAFFPCVSMEQACMEKVGAWN